jgi:hypothetical protein
LSTSITSNLSSIEHPSFAAGPLRRTGRAKSIEFTGFIELLELLGFIGLLGLLGFIVFVEFIEFVEFVEFIELLLSAAVLQCCCAAVHRA